MRTFPAQFTAEMQKQTGACPLWIFEFIANGVTYYISDVVFDVAPWGITTKAWIKTGGFAQLQEGISNAIDEFKISDLTLTGKIDPAASPNLRYLVKNYNIKASAVSLYLWFYGITDPPQEMFRGYIRKHPIPDETTVELYIQDETLRFERTYVGELVDTQVYPNADPDDVGKMIPLPFGTVKKVLAVAVNAGKKTSLPANINAAVTSFLLSETGFTAGMTITVDEEEIYLNTVSGETVTSCVRGYNGTLAAVHQKAAVVWEKKTSFDYLVSSRPLDSLPKVYSRIGQADLDITSICTRYTGKPGNEHATYPGKAVVTVPGYITASQAIDLLLNDGIGVNDAKGIVDGIGVSDTIGVTDTIGVATGSHNHGTTKTVTDPQDAAWPSGLPASVTPSGYTTGNGSTTFPAAPATGRISSTFTINLQCYGLANLQIWVNGTLQYNATPPSQTFSFSKKFTDGNGLASNHIGYVFTGAVGVSPQGVTAVSAQRVVEYSDPVTSSAATGVSKTGTAAKSGAAAKSGTVALSGVVSKTGTVSLTGNSVANTLVGEAILVDVADALTKPADVISWLAQTYCNLSSARLVGDLPSFYEINGVIRESKRALEWFNVLAFECRCRFEMRLGSARIIYRPDTVTPVKTLATCRISSGKKDYSEDDSSFTDIINKIDLLFDRDYSQDSASYRGIAKDKNQSSIDVHGVQERPDLFKFNFVTSQQMANHVLGFYLLYYAYQHWGHKFKTFLMDMDLEYADGVKLGFADNVTGEVIQVRPAPGQTTKNDVIEITVVQ